MPRSASAPGRRGGFKDFDDEFYLRDQREWTSVRDSQLRSRTDLADLPPAELQQRRQQQQQEEEEVPSVLRDSRNQQQPKRPEQPLADVDLLSD